MLGDTAVAINPTSKKTQHLRGKTALLPFIGRELPLIEDDHVVAEFGAGALKVTPGHDPNDFEIGKRHDLEEVTILTEDARINENGGEFAGMDRFEARDRIVERLEEMELLEKIEDNPNKIGRCHRCHTIIEPRISLQWFVKMKPLAEPALAAYEKGDVRFIPDHWGKTYTHWLTNVRDWVISRQLWWGHRIPVYYCDGCNKEIAGREAPRSCPDCNEAGFRQDPDVLDTWFSSWLWPFSTLGWPKKTMDLDYFYPTNWLTTGPDIIFFWVSRMIMSGLEFMGEVPFREVYLHGIVRDNKGRKLSKSLGNSPDPNDIIDTYGGDAIRFTMIALTPTGQDVTFDAKKTELGRNFANKIWNAARFVLMNLDDYDPDAKKAEPEMADRWILSRLDEVVESVTLAFEENRFSDAAWSLYDFMWKEYCDWYLEFAKSRFYGDDTEARSRAQDTALGVLGRSMALLHPLYPFLTEVIWEHLPGAEGLLMTSRWPKAEGRADELAEQDVRFLQAIIVAIRNMRAEMNVSPGTSGSVVVRAEGDPAAALAHGDSYLKALARVGDITVAKGAEKPPKSASAVVEGMEIFLPLEGLIDLDAERQRLEKKRDELAQGLAGADRKLQNASFVSRAPAEVVQSEKERRERLATDLIVVERNLAALTEES
jgi:valyl-tRNA synthetase